MASIPRLNSCCCGCTLRTGTLILLYLTLIGAVLYPFSHYQPTSAATDASGHKPSSTIGEQPVSVRVAGGIVGVIIAVAGLYGVYKEKHGFLLPYLVFNAIYIVGFLILGVIVVIVNIIAGFIWLVCSLPGIYFWLVVYNHYRELQEGKGSSSAA